MSLLPLVDAFESFADVYDREKRSLFAFTYGNERTVWNDENAFISREKQKNVTSAYIKKEAAQI